VLDATPARPKRKPPSGAQRRKLRAARGLPTRSEAEIVSSHERSAKRQSANIAWIGEYKLSKGCADCGYDGHFAALQFDHLPGYEKVNGLGQMVKCSRERILKEIEKCEVVCANCHAIRTFNRRRELREVLL
jgi:hypothetical protein